MSLVITSLGGRHIDTHRHMHTHTDTHTHTHTHILCTQDQFSRNQACAGLWLACTWFKIAIIRKRNTV